MNIGKHRKGLFLLLTLTAGLGLMQAGQVTAQTFKVLHTFTAESTTPPYGNSDGAYPYARLILSGNTLYGVAAFGGTNGNGTVFVVNTDGTDYTNLHSLAAGSGSFPNVINSDGANPQAGLILSGKTLYGVASYGGTNGNGTVFAVNTDGTGFTILHTFPRNSVTNSDGANPQAELILSGNRLYGTAQAGGTHGNGTVFALNIDGTGFTNLHSFTAKSTVSPYGNSDGANPFAGLILSGNTLYGTASFGGSSGNGTVFAVNTDGTGFTNLHSFTGSDGAYPRAGLILSSNTLYGTAQTGGRSGRGTVFAINTAGTGFTDLHSFIGSDGLSPAGGLILSSNTLYGTAEAGGSSGNGTVFAINADGTGFTNLHSFISSDGAYPSAGLILSSNTLYGTASYSGSSGYGTVFSFSLQFGAIYADFTTPTIQTNNMTITPGPYFAYNTNYPGSWDIAAVSFGFIGTFDVPSNGTYLLTVNHQTSAAASCPGGGYSPINIYVNGAQIASNFDPAQQSGGSHNEVTNSWLITATAGVDNTLKWAAGPLCSRYWIQGIQIAPAPARLLTIIPYGANVILSWPANGFTLQSTTNLSSPDWTTNSATPVVVNGQNTVTNPIPGTQQFFRLSQ
jgi:uncharacterized repeat protein (TIGR03803 family)